MADRDGVHLDFDFAAFWRAQLHVFDDQRRTKFMGDCGFDLLHGFCPCCICLHAGWPATVAGASTDATRA